MATVLGVRAPCPLVFKLKLHIIEGESSIATKKSSLLRKWLWVQGGANYEKPSLSLTPLMSHSLSSPEFQVCMPRRWGPSSTVALARHLAEF